MTNIIFWIFIINLAVIFSAIHPTISYADEGKVVDVQHQDGVYRVGITFKIAGSLENIKHALTDYQNLNLLDPSITDVEILKSPDKNKTRVKTILRECVFVFCKQVIRTEDVGEDVHGNLHARIVPELSDVKSGHSKWQFQTMDNEVEIRYSSRLEPRFWIPPLIGPGLLRKNLREHVLEAATNLEKLVTEN